MPRVAGTYMDQTGQQVCLLCPAGSATNKNGSASCAPCLVIQIALLCCFLHVDSVAHRLVNTRAFLDKFSACHVCKVHSAHVSLLIGSLSHRPIFASSFAVPLL